MPVPVETINYDSERVWWNGGRKLLQKMPLIDTKGDPILPDQLSIYRLSDSCIAMVPTAALIKGEVKKIDSADLEGNSRIVAGQHFFEVSGNFSELNERFVRISVASPKNLKVGLLNTRTVDDINDGSGYFSGNIGSVRLFENQMDISWFNFYDNSWDNERRYRGIAFIGFDAKTTPYPISGLVFPANIITETD
jgi:hypothetical protein